MSLLAVAPCQAQDNLLNESGTSILADVYGTATGPEALTVSWSVVENTPGVYTYTYIIDNPPGDVLLPGSFDPGLPESVDSFAVSFNAAAPGAVVPNTLNGGSHTHDLGSAGLSWSMPSVDAGTNSPPLSFQSDDAPTMGNASASDANPPSPWSSSPDGDQVPVPNVPDSTNTAALLAGALLLLLPGMRKKASPSS